MTKKGGKNKRKVVRRGSKLKSVKIKNINLTKYFSPLFGEVLEKEYGTACIVPIGVIICTCRSKGENQKIFLLQYPTSKDYQKKIVTVTSNEISDRDLKKLRKAFAKGKINRGN